MKAGGIDLIDLMKEGLLAPAEVTSLQGVPGLSAIAPTPEGGLSVGPMVTLARLAADPSIRERYPALAEAAGESASPQIRAVATIGGNLLQRPRCWYFRAAEFRCLRKGGGHCYAISGENQGAALSQIENDRDVGQRPVERFLSVDPTRSIGGDRRNCAGDRSGRRESLESRCPRRW